LEFFFSGKAIQLSIIHCQLSISTHASSRNADRQKGLRFFKMAAAPHREISEELSFQYCRSPEWKKAIEIFLESYRLILNPERTELYPATEGKCFLGQKVFQSYRRLPSDNVRRAKKRIQCTLLAKPETMQQSLSGWVGHARQANTRNLLRSMGMGG